jgi:hypothetical protein
MRARAQDKILQSIGRGQEVMVTNDGATILKSLYVDNPAAKVLVGARHKNPLGKRPCMQARALPCTSQAALHTCMHAALRGHNTATHDGVVALPRPTRKKRGKKEKKR